MSEKKRDVPLHKESEEGIGALQGPGAWTRVIAHLVRRTSSDATLNTATTAMRESSEQKEKGDRTGDTCNYAT